MSFLKVPVCMDFKILYQNDLIIFSMILFERHSDGGTLIPLAPSPHCQPVWDGSRARRQHLPCGLQEPCYLSNCWLLLRMNFGRKQVTSQSGALNPGTPLWSMSLFITRPNAPSSTCLPFHLPQTSWITFFDALVWIPWICVPRDLSQRRRGSDWIGDIFYL